MRRFWIAAVAAACLLAVAIGIFRRRGGLSRAPSHDGEPSPPPLVHTEALPGPTAEPHPEASAVDGLDLLRMTETDSGWVAPVAAGTAHLTLDPNLQRTALALLETHPLREGAVVLMDVASGRLLVYASHLEQGTQRDLCAEATAPSASVFKIVTAAALVEDGGLGADTKQCYSGGEQRIAAIDLIEDPKRDKWCATLGTALGRSLNTVFARLASTHLTPDNLEAMARRLGYGQSLSFDVPVQPSAVHVPSEPLAFARTAAGFWNTTLSPLEAAELSAIVARGGETVRPAIAERVVDEAGATLWSAPAARPWHRAMARETAEQVAAMMSHTVSEGTSFRAFHDGRGEPFLPGVAVGGKTGTLTDPEPQRFFTWFTGFAPLHADAGIPQVAVAVLVVNGPVWHVKANVVARDMLRAYFAAHNVDGVTQPSLHAVARHHSTREAL